MGARWTVEFYRTIRGEEPAKRFLESLQVKPRAKAARWLALLEQKGPDLPRPYADTLDGPIHELRVASGRLAIRLLYFFHDTRIIVVAHGFLKKTRTIPEQDIQLAHRARRDWLARHGGKT